MKLFITALAALVLAAPVAFASEGEDHSAHAEAPKKEKKAKKAKAAAKNPCAKAEVKNPCAKTEAAPANPCAPKH